MPDLLDHQWLGGGGAEPGSSRDRGHVMDSMDAYLSRLLDPALRSFNRKLRGIDEGDPEPAHSKVTEEQVSAAEQALGVALPPSYKKLVMTAQPFDAEYGVYWVSDNEADQYIPDIVTTNRGPLAWFPPFLVAVLGSDDGDEYCFDTRYPDGRGEYPIVFLNHEIHGEHGTEFERVAQDLGEFLLGSLGGETSA